jgi:putative heme iron utilization protein
MESSVAEAARLVTCEKCGAQVAKHRIEKHIRRVHSPEREAALAAALAENQAANARAQFLKQSIRCPVCQAVIKLSGVKSHFGNVHAKPAPAELLRIVDESGGANRFKSDREREAYWRRQSGISYEEGNDLFDRTKVLSGGAFGLGKNRRN